MSLHLEFEPHSWYMGFAIKFTKMGRDYQQWTGYTDNGNTYAIDEIEAFTLAELKQKIRYYHVKAGNGYGERIKARAGIK